MGILDRPCFSGHVDAVLASPAPRSALGRHHLEPLADQLQIILAQTGVPALDGRSEQDVGLVHRTTVGEGGKHVGHL